MQSTARIKTFVGFAVRAGKIVWGTDNVLAWKKKLRLILASSDVSENALEKIRRYADDKPAKLSVLSCGEVAELVHREGVKVIGITDKNLADAIVQELEKEIKE